MSFFKNKFYIALLGLLSFIAVSCYSFSGNTLDKRIKTIQIKQILNNAPLINPTLAQDFSISIQNRFLQRTTLVGSANDPDLSIEGEITDYSVLPTTISSGANANTGVVIQAAQNKLTISVKIRYENKYEPEKSFERTYTDEATFSSDLSQQEIESGQVKIVTERVINKIFNDIMNNW